MSITLTLRSGELLAERVEWAQGPLARARGLIARTPPAPGTCLVLDRAAQVHTFGMRYPIDVFVL